MCLSPLAAQGRRGTAGALQCGVIADVGCRSSTWQSSAWMGTQQHGAKGDVGCRSSTCRALPGLCTPLVAPRPWQSDEASVWVGAMGEPRALWAGEHGRAGAGTPGDELHPQGEVRVHCRAHVKGLLPSMMQRRKSKDGACWTQPSVTLGQLQM